MYLNNKGQRFFFLTSIIFKIEKSTCKVDIPVAVIKGRLIEAFKYITSLFFHLTHFFIIMRRKGFNTYVEFENACSTLPVCLHPFH